MEGLWGSLIIIFFIVISVLGKLVQKKKEGQDAPPASESPDLEGLPEIVRRMLYGPQAARKATPARPATHPDQEAVEQPRPVTIRSVPPRGTPYQPPVARPAPPRPQAPVTPRPVVVPSAWEPPVPPARRPARPLPQEWEEEGPRRPLPPQAPVPTAGPGLRQPPRPAAPRPVTTEPTGGPPEGRKAVMLHALLGDLQDVRRGIVLSEILGPPMAFR